MLSTLKYVFRYERRVLCRAWLLSKAAAVSLLTTTRGQIVSFLIGASFFSVAFKVDTVLAISSAILLFLAAFAVNCFVAPAQLAKESEDQIAELTEKKTDREASKQIASSLAGMLDAGVALYARRIQTNIEYSVWDYESAEWFRETGDALSKINDHLAFRFSSAGIQHRQMQDLREGPQYGARRSEFAEKIKELRDATDKYLAASLR